MIKEEIQKIFKQEKKAYKKESAGSIMDTNIPIIKSGSTLGDLKKYLEENISTFHSISYIYVIDEDEKMVGVLSIKEVFSGNLDMKVDDLMEKHFISTTVNTDQEQVALIALQKNIKSVPVIDKSGVLIGAVLKDALLNVLHNESVEDALVSSGIRKIENPFDIVDAGSWLHFKKRFPWLLLGLVGGIFAAFLVKLFEETLAFQIILVSFIPAILYMAGAVGGQTEVIFIKSLTLSKNLNLKKYILREMKVSLLLSFILGSLSFLATIIWTQSFIIALIMGLSIIVTVILSTIIGIMLPYVLNKIGKDPAFATGPFGAVLRDILSLLIYFGIIILLM